MYFFKRAPFMVNYIMDSFRYQYRSVMRVSKRLRLLTNILSSILASTTFSYSHSASFGSIIT